MSSTQEPVMEPEVQPTFELLLVTAHCLGIEADAALSDEGVSTMGLVALSMIIRARNRMTVRSLAAQLGSSQQSATELVNRLVRDGVVERVMNPHDGRSKLLSVTDRGLLVGEWAGEAVGFCMSAFTRSFSPDEKTMFLQLLGRLERNARWHRTERLWNIHRFSLMGARSERRPRPPHLPAPVHVR